LIREALEKKKEREREREKKRKIREESDCDEIETLIVIPSSKSFISLKTYVCPFSSYSKTISTFSSSLIFDLMSFSNS